MQVLSLLLVSIYVTWGIILGLISFSKLNESRAVPILRIIFVVVLVALPLGSFLTMGLGGITVTKWYLLAISVISHFFVASILLTHVKKGALEVFMDIGCCMLSLIAVIAGTFVNFSFNYTLIMLAITLSITRLFRRYKIFSEDAEFSEDTFGPKFKIIPIIFISFIILLPIATVELTMSQDTATRLDLSQSYSVGMEGTVARGRSFYMSLCASLITLFAMVSVEEVREASHLLRNYALEFEKLEKSTNAGCEIEFNSLLDTFRESDAGGFVTSIPKDTDTCELAKQHSKAFAIQLKRTSRTLRPDVASKVGIFVMSTFYMDTIASLGTSVFISSSSLKSGWELALCSILIVLFAMGMIAMSMKRKEETCPVGWIMRSLGCVCPVDSKQVEHRCEVCPAGTLSDEGSI